MAQYPGSTVTLTIVAPGSQIPPVSNIPWYPGIRVLDAMIVAQAMVGPTAFNFRLVYHSTYGAYVDTIDDAAEGGGNYWLLSIDNVMAQYGPAEQIITEPPQGANASVVWNLAPPSAQPSSSQLAQRMAVASF